MCKGSLRSPNNSTHNSNQDFISNQWLLDRWNNVYEDFFSGNVNCTDGVDRSTRSGFSPPDTVREVPKASKFGGTFVKKLCGAMEMKTVRQ